MMRKSLRLATGLLAVCCFASVFTGCDEHEHTYSENWSYDDTYHWQVPTCNDTDEVANLGPHNFIHDVCHVCGYSRAAAVEKEYYDVTYGVDGEGGTIEGEKVQRVKNGGSSEPVKAVPDKGFLFVMWSDGNIQSDRHDENVKEDLNLLAYFEPDPDSPDFDDEGEFGNDHEEEESKETQKGETKEQDDLIYTQLKSVANGDVTGWSVRLKPESTKTDIKISDKIDEYEVKEIENDAFMGSSIQTIEIPNTITKIGHKAFMNCYSLQEVTIPDSVLDVGNQAFQNCTQLKEVKLSNQMEGVWYKMFYGCRSLTEITFPDSVKSVGRYAFYNCTQLKSVKFGKGIEKCGAKAFQSCTGLQKVEIEDLKAWCETTFDFFMQALSSTFESNPLFYAHNLYMSDSPNTPVTDLKIPENTTEISSYAFIDCDSIKHVKVPGSVKLIGNLVFSNCTALEDVEIEEGPISAGYSLFLKCSNLRTVKFPDSLTSIGQDPDELEQLHHSVFESCPALTEVTVGNGLKTMNCTLFRYCEQLATVHFTGAAAEWRKILDQDWASQCGNEITVCCTDYDLTYKQTEHVDNYLKTYIYTEQSATPKTN